MISKELADFLSEDFHTPTTEKKMVSKELADLLEEDFRIRTRENGITELNLLTPNNEDWELNITGKNEDEFLENLYKFIENFDPEVEFKYLQDSDSDYRGYGELWEDQLWKADFLNGLERKVRALIRQREEKSKYISKEYLKLLNKNDIYVKRVRCEDDEEHIEHITLSMFTSSKDWYVIYFSVRESIDFSIAFKFAFTEQMMFNVNELVEAYQEDSSEALKKLSLLAERKKFLEEVVRKLRALESEE